MAAPLDDLWIDDDRRDGALTRLWAKVTVDAPQRGSLTEAERLTLQAFASGCQRREAAVVLGVTPEAVKSRLLRARRTLGAKNTTHAVALAFRRGLIY